jgi:probable F420-dependent oxidoreductase
MHIGAFIFTTDYGIRIDELARELEQRGFESVFLPEHTHIPASRRSPFPAGGPLPLHYSHTHDPFVALSFAAAATTKLKLGTGICLLAQRDPIVTAKSAASLDLLSGGRFIMGLGGGWNVEEMENHGATYDTRFAILRENVLAMKELWTKEEAEFHGKHVNFDPVWLHPKPAQRPHPPLVMGGETQHTLRRVIEFCDGWFPRASPRFDPVEGMSRMRQAAAEANRDPATLSMSVFRAPADKAEHDRYRQAGVDRVLLELPPDSRDATLKRLDEYAPLLQ